MHGVGPGQKVVYTSESQIHPRFRKSVMSQIVQGVTSGPQGPQAHSGKWYPRHPTATLYIFHGGQNVLLVL